MKKWLLPVLFILCLGCTKDEFIPLSDCQPSIVYDNFSHPKHAQFTQWIDAYSLRGYPGLVLCVRDSSGRFWLDSRGQAVIEESTSLLPCHRQHSASVSKTYIAVLVMKLYEQGLLDLDERLAAYLPFDLDIENYHCVTVRQLLAHQSGIFDFDTNPKIFVDYLNDPFQVDSWQEVLERYVEGQEAEFPCGTSTEYSDTNYLLLGVLIEQLTGKPLGRVMEEELLMQHGLHETYYKASEGYPDIVATANSYFYFSEDKLQNCTDWQQHFANISMGHEGIIATPSDYVIFLHQLVNDQVLETKSLEEMKSFSASVENDTELGLGLERMPTPYGDVYGHSGGGFGTMTLLFHEAETGTTFFVGANLGAIFDSEAGDLFYEDLLYELVNIIKS